LTERVLNADVTLDTGMRTTLTTGQVKQVYFSVDHQLDTVIPPAQATQTQMFNYPRISCDKGVYYKDSGCVFAGAKSVLVYSLSSAAHGQVAVHVRDAQNALSTHPGRLTNWTKNGTPLHRTTVTAIKNANTAAKNAACARLTRPTGYQCDEYPFASTKEGGNTGIFSVKMVNGTQNMSAGGSLGVLYDLGRVGNGGEFWVQIVS